jgi:hypothetical protein
MALASATALEPDQRPKSAQLFADSLLPWIWTEKSVGRPSVRWVTALQKLTAPSHASMTSWTVSHPPGDDRVVLSTAWNGAGHALAVTTRGLCYWNGTSWLETRGQPFANVHFVRRLSPTSWVVGAECGQLYEYSRQGCQELVSGPDSSVTFVD